LSGEKIAGTAHGTINPNGANDFSLDLASKDGASLPLAFGDPTNPTKIELGTLSAKATGPAAQTRLDVTAALPSLVAGPATAKAVSVLLHSDGFDVTKRAGPVSATVSADRIDLANASLAPLLAGKVVAQVAGNLTPDAFGIENGSLRSDALNAGLTGKVSLADGAVDLNLKADAAASALPAAARGLLGERATLNAALKRDAGGDITVNPIRLASGPLSADGQASVTDNKVSAVIKGALADISGLSKDAKGAISFSLNADGPVAAPDLSMTVGSDRLTVAEREITGLKLTATGKADAANPAANVQLTGNVAGQPLQGSAVLATTNGQSAINGLLLSLGKNRISGDLALDEKFVPAGTIAIDLPDIGPLAALALQKAAGDVRGTIVFTKKGDAPQVAVRVNTAMLTRGDLQAKAVSIDALVANYLAAPVISGKIQADTVTSGGTVISGINVDLKRDGEWTAFS
ncbi:MAG: translocation/assembly module TamB, partial [Mesorhizobium sp.]|nr:translocation/assembly module TamB [Mesorhizobium sp.]